MTLQPIAALPIDAELWWATYLRDALELRGEDYAENVYVGNRMPSTRPARVVLVRRDGGNVSGVFDNPRVSFDVWANARGEATQLSTLVIALAFMAPGVNGCTRVRHLSGPNSIPESSTAERRLSLIEATHRVNVL